MKPSDHESSPADICRWNRSAPSRSVITAWLALAALLLGLTGCSSRVDSDSHAASYERADQHMELEGRRLRAAALRSRLHRQMSQQRWLPRSGEWQVLEQGAASSSSEMTLFYTRRTVLKSRRASGTHQAQPDYWNREHLWPRSYGLKGTAADRDLHNLVPADRTVNSSRGNKMFDTAVTPHRECRLCRVSRQAWEPPDEVKGDIARILFYMDVRYEGDTGLEADASLPDLVLAELADPARRQIGPLHTLLAWHCNDAVSMEERSRHEVVAAVQGNRNVFVDDPTLVERVYQYNCHTVSD